MDRNGLLKDIRLKPIKILPGRRVVNPNPGEWTSPFVGKGFETRGFRDFELGDDPRAVHLSTSIRRGVKTIVERIALRDLTVMVLLDLTPSMLVRSKFRTQMVAAALLLYSAWKVETTFGLAIHDGERVNSYGKSIGTRHFHKLYNKLWDVYSSNGENRNGLGRKTHLRHSFSQNSIIFYFSDFLNEDGELMDIVHLWRQAQRYDFVPVIIQDEFECTFPLIETGSFLGLDNPETGQQNEIWLSKDDSNEIREINEGRFRQLKELFNKNNSFTIHLSDPDISKISIEIIQFFEQRKRRGAR